MYLCREVKEKNHDMPIVPHEVLNIARANVSCRNHIKNHAGTPAAMIFVNNNRIDKKTKFQTVKEL